MARLSRRAPAYVSTPVQARTVDQQDGLGVADRYACSSCRITYQVAQGERARCPLCDMKRRYLELQNASTMLRNQLELSEESRNALGVVADVVVAMQRAMDLVDLDDMTFLKSVLYRFRQDSTDISLGVLRAKAENGRSRVIGFLAHPRYGDPEPRACTSVGGVALAGYYDEVSRSTGSVAALSTLIRAMNQVLATGD